MNGSAQARRTFYVLLSLFLIVVALRLAQDVFVPLALSVLMTLLLAPLVNRLQRWRINRTIAVFVTVAVAFVAVGGILYVVFDQLRDLAHELPQYRRQLMHNITQLSGALRGPTGRFMSFFSQLRADLQRVAPPAQVTHPVPKVEVIEPPLNGLDTLRHVFGPLVGPVATAGVVVVFVIFMLLRFTDLRDRLIRLLGSRNLRLTSEAMDEAARRVSQFLVMQTLINCWEGLCVAVGLTLIGVPNAILWGALTAVLRFIPYIGIWVAAGMPVALSFAVFDRWTPTLASIGLFIGVEALSYLVLEPWLYSRRTGVSPFALLLAAMFWAWLWGAVGLFLAIPLTVCLVVMGKYVPQLAFLFVLLGDEPALDPHERLYHRLLANNPEEADDLLESLLRHDPLVEVCDGVLLPTMRIIERDHEQGVLRDVTRQYALDYMDRWTEELTESAGRAHPRPGFADRPVPGAEPEVLCLPAADRADEIAARLLAAVLTSQDIRARASPRVQLRNLGEEPAPALIAISSLPRDAVTHARHVSRRTRAQFGTVPIIAGIWDNDADLARAGERLRSAGVTHVATSFAQALAQIRQSLSRGAAPPEATPAEAVTP
jgi:predicted PurR-regulated permease PerM